MNVPLLLIVFVSEYYVNQTTLQAFGFFRQGIAASN
jgi:hypothetical protein